MWCNPINLFTLGLVGLVLLVDNLHFLSVGISIWSFQLISSKLQLALWFHLEAGVLCLWKVKCCERMKTGYFPLELVELQLSSSIKRIVFLSMPRWSGAVPGFDIVIVWQNKALEFHSLISHTRCENRYQLDFAYSIQCGLITI